MLSFQNADKESAFLVKLLCDEQLAADASWARVQSCLLILRYSLAAKLIYFAQTIEPSIVAPFAQQFDEIMRNTYLKIIDLESINAETRRRLHPFDFCALSFERHGFWAKETISFTRKLAYALSLIHI